jgi:SSS family solute:Na+ symporter
MELSTLDFVIFGAYCLIIVAIGLYVSREKKGHVKDSKDYFLASKSLPWWAIGASLIAANISAEQFIGMSGSGFAIGLAIASYEWMAAITLLIVGKYFLPIFIEKKLYTIPEFLEQRYSTNLKSILAIFWIALFIFVNLTSVLYLGSKALDTIVGQGDGSLIVPSIIGLALFAAAYSLWGGLKAVAWTDVVQVVVLVVGGLITTFIALSHISPDGGIFSGLELLFDRIPEKFSMILDKGEIITPNGDDAWWDLPGLSVLIGGLWIANLYYWGFNQYIIQRTLAAKSLKESQRGIVFAAALKLIIPLIVVIPGMIAYFLNAGPEGNIVEATVDPSFINSAGNIDNDQAFPWLIDRFIPIGMKGLVLAALTAAIVSSLASMLNSTATIFTMDIYKPLINPGVSESGTVRVGRITATAALVVACFIAPLLGGIKQAFQYIQEYTGLVSPGILAIFMLGLFWKKTTNKGAIWGALASIPIAMYLKVGSKGWVDPDSALSVLFPRMPFMNQMGITFILTVIIIMLVSYSENKGVNDPKGIDLSKKLFATGPAFNIGAFAILIVLAVLYAVFW